MTELQETTLAVLVQDFFPEQNLQQHEWELHAVENEMLLLLSQRIGYLLEKDFEQLMQIFYRIDLDEKRVKNILLGQTYSNPTMQLAELVLEREKQKAHYRIKYKTEQAKNI